MKSLLIFGLLAVVVVVASKKSYSGHQVLRVQVSSKSQAETLTRLENNGIVDLWNDIPSVAGGTVDVMVNADKADTFSKMLKALHMDSSVMVADVQDLIDQETETMEQLATAKSMDRMYRQFAMDWNSYHTLEDFYEYFDYIEANFDYVKSEIIGQSYEGRDLRLLHICKGGCGNKPAMFIEGGIHAREWISPAVVMWFAKELTQDLTAANQDLVDKLDWYILPSVNPDGYAFTQDTVNGDRLWRKTRSPTNSPLGCVGADPNRNWDFHFGEAGTSDNPCSDTYHGLGPFSESETKAVSDWITANNADDNIKFFNDMHSYSQYILLPWGFEAPQPPPDHTRRLEVAEKGNAALRALYGTIYQVGSITDLLYPAAGGSLDWTLGVEGVKYSYGMELRDTGTFGFLLPPGQIIPTSEESWAFHVSVARDVIAEFAK